MSKLQYFKEIPGGVSLFNYFDKNLTWDLHSGTFAEFHEVGGEPGMVTLKGHDLVYDNTGNIIDGIVTSVTFGTDDGEVFARLTGFKIKAEIIGTASNFDIIDIAFTTFETHNVFIGSRHDDILIGVSAGDTFSAGDGQDTLRGSQGNDRYTGGKGSDRFEVGVDEGKDVITDFDATDGGAKQDYLVTGGDPYTLKTHGHDVILKFGDGEQVTLLGVSKNDIDAFDFI